MESVVILIASLSTITAYEHNTFWRVCSYCSPKECLTESNCDQTANSTAHPTNANMCYGMEGMEEEWWCCDADWPYWKTAGVGLIAAMGILGTIFVSCCVFTFIVCVSPSVQYALGLIPTVKRKRKSEPGLSSTQQSSPTESTQQLSSHTRDYSNTTQDSSDQTQGSLVPTAVVPVSSDS